MSDEIVGFTCHVSGFRFRYSDFDSRLISPKGGKHVLSPSAEFTLSPSAALRVNCARNLSQIPRISVS